MDKYHRKIVVELRYTPTPSFFDISGKFASIFISSGFDRWSRDNKEDKMLLLRSKNGEEERIAFTPINFVYSLEMEKDEHNFNLKFNKVFEKFSGLNIAHRFIRIGLRTFSVYYRLSFQDVFNKSKSFFEKSGLLDQIGNRFNYNDFAIILQGEMNRLEFGAIKKGEIDPHFGHFEILDKPLDDDVLFVDTDFGKRDITGSRDTKATVRKLLKNNTEVTSKLYEYFIGTVS